jgi:hypothetical protein
VPTEDETEALVSVPLSEAASDSVAVAVLSSAMEVFVLAAPSSTTPF